VISLEVHVLYVPSPNTVSQTQIVQVLFAAITFVLMHAIMVSKIQVMVKLLPIVVVQHVQQDVILDKHVALVQTARARFAQVVCAWMHAITVPKIVAMVKLIQIVVVQLVRQDVHLTSNVH